MTTAMFDLDSWLAEVDDVAPIVQAGAPVLRRRSEAVPRSLIGTEALERLVDIMVATMRAAPGVGLAAPQIGVPYRIFVAEDDEERMARLSKEARDARGRSALPLVVVVNPTVSPVSTDTCTFYEGCLSVRGYAALVPRAKAVSVKGTGPRGAATSFRLEGWPARIMQHEMDHLDGTLYVDRMVSRSLAGDAELARLSAMTPDEVLAEIEEVAPNARGD